MRSTSDATSYTPRVDALRNFIDTDYGVPDGWREWTVDLVAQQACGIVW
jgi:hypothetical protein